jgi:5'(3')-deoxyribonucleotidase
MKIAPQKYSLAIDIDDTLADTKNHFVHLLNAKFGNPEKLSDVAVIQKYNIVPNMFFWQTPEIAEWLKEQAYSNSAQQKVSVMPGAINAIKEIAKKVDVIYMSARPIEVFEGTKNWLKFNGFPEGEIILHTTYDNQNGNAWKARILEQKYPQCLGIIDDNAEIISHFERLYKGVVFLYGATSIAHKTDILVYPCPTWDDVLEAFRRDPLLS